MRYKDKLFGIGIVLCSLIAVKTEGQEKNHVKAEGQEKNHVKTEGQEKNHVKTEGQEKNHRPHIWDQFCVFPVRGTGLEFGYYLFEAQSVHQMLKCPNFNKCWNTVIAKFGEGGYELVSTHLDRGTIITACFKKEKSN